MRLVRGICLCALVLACGTAGAASVTVTNTNDSGSGSLRDAIAQANADTGSASTISITATGTIALLSGLATSTPLAITGPGASQLTIAGATGGPVFTTSASALTVSGVTITGGGSEMLDAGSVFEATGPLALVDVVLTSSTSSEGAVITGFGGVTLTRTTITGCSALIGVIYLRASAAIVDSTIASNSGTAIVTVGDGAVVTITGSTIANNTASGGVGGIQVQGGSVLASNSTFSGNQGAEGGDLWTYSSGVTIQLDAVTLSGGMPNALFLQNPGTVTAHDTILTSAGTACTGAITSLGHNLAGDTSCGLGSGSGDLQGVDPMLGALGSNGGPTQTMRPMAGSPAINAGEDDAGSGSGSATDQRGRPRVVFSAQDIGAVEYGAPTIVGPTTPVSVNVGATLELQVTATDPENGTLTYQWLKDGQLLTGAAAPGYIKTNVDASDAGSYTVAVTNGGGTVTSSAAVVTVGYPADDFGVSPDAGTSSSGNGGGCCSAQGDARGAIGSVALGLGVIALAVGKRRRRRR